MDKTTILYVDDEEINLKIFQVNLARRYNVVTAIDAEEGLALLDSNKDIALVLSDLQMPKVDGLEFIGQAKLKHPEKKYYLLTGYEIGERIQAALDSELIINSFGKPLDFNKIEEEFDAITDTLSQS